MPTEASMADASEMSMRRSLMVQANPFAAYGQLATIDRPHPLRVLELKVRAKAFQPVKRPRSGPLDAT